MIYDENNPMPAKMLREINDSIRARMSDIILGNGGWDGRIILTASINESAKKYEILNAIKTFNSFTPDNDPHKEHDFGAVEVDGERYLFKFDYYDKNLEFFGYDNFVMTIMHSSEY